MTKYIELKGTKEQIINQLMKQNQDEVNEITKQSIGDFLDIIEENYTLLSDDEMFEKRTFNCVGQSKFITANAEYYISIKNFTLVIISIIASAKKIPIQFIFRALGIDSEKVYLKKLDSTLGESCIMLEAMRKKKKGINKNLFQKNNGECINSYLNCNYNISGKCTCIPNSVEDICERLVEKKMLLKKKINYFYLDII